MQQIFSEPYMKENCIYILLCEGLGTQCFQVLYLSQNQVPT